MKVKFTSDQICDVVENVLIPKIEGRTVFLVSGQLGAGKTTTAKALAKTLGVKEAVVSPTFTYVSVYELEKEFRDAKKFLHFDLYRLSSTQEFINLGLADIFSDEDAVCYVEWPEILIEDSDDLGLENTRVVKLNFEHCQGDEQARMISVLG